MTKELKEETKEMINSLSTSPDFLASLQSCIDHWKKTEEENNEVNFVQLCLYMFCQGYLSGLDYKELKDKLRPLDLRPYM